MRFQTRRNHSATIQVLPAGNEVTSREVKVESAMPCTLSFAFFRISGLAVLTGDWNALPEIVGGHPAYFNEAQKLYL